MSIAAINWAKLQRVGDLGAKFYLFALAERANAEGKVWAAQTTLAAEMECTTRSTQKYRKHLEDIGLIERELRNRENGSRTSDMITLRMAENSSPPPEKSFPPGTAKNSPPPVAKSSPPEEPPLKEPPFEPGAADAAPRRVDLENAAFAAFQDLARRIGCKVPPAKNVHKSALWRVLRLGGLHGFMAEIERVENDPGEVQHLTEVFTFDHDAPFSRFLSGYSYRLYTEERKAREARQALEPGY